MNGFVLYRGPSKSNGHPIVSIATDCKRPVSNKKTGTCQVYILRGI